MTQRMDRLIDAIAECIVACQGRVNRDRAKAVLAEIEAQGWRLVREERHTHVAGPGDDIDCCRKCGRDIRDQIHFRMHEGKI
jgi:hypothetical protein